MLRNPYTPGAGCMPPFLAGRDGVLNEAQVALERLKAGFPQRSSLYYGLRGVGKTALLNAIEEFADNLDVIYAHIEATEEQQFMRRLVAALGRFTRGISPAEALKETKERCLRLIQSISITYTPTDNKFAFSLSPDENTASGDLTDDITEVLVMLGKLAVKSRDAFCIFIDEMQNTSIDQTTALVSAVHRCNQLRLPVMLCCAGLPKAVEILNRSCSYSERMFEYVQVDKLSDEEARAAITEPARELGVLYRDDALSEIVSITSCYPYYIQEYCSVIWDSLPEDSTLVTLNDVRNSRMSFFRKLDRGFFEARYSRCSPSERQFMLAMAACGKSPCQISEVAERMGKKVQQISPHRATLIDKGIIYAPARGEVDFTVPLFGDYLSRVTEDDYNG